LVPKRTFPSKKIIKTDNYKDGDTLSYQTTLEANSIYSITIKTVYIYNKAYINNDWVSDLNNVVTLQKIIFKKNQQILVQRKFNVKKYKINNNNRTLYFLDNVIREVGIVKGDKGAFYKIYGFGGCNSCSEFLGYFSLDGKLLYKIYTSKMDNYAYKYGSFQNVINHYGIPHEKIKKNDTKSVTVFPPQFSGKIENTSIN
jgi:hypothetical protein